VDEEGAHHFLVLVRLVQSVGPGAVLAACDFSGCRRKGLSVM
jgi:hypothetical protein